MKGFPGIGTGDGAADGETHMVDPVVEVVEPAHPSQLRDTPEGVVVGIDAPEGVVTRETKYGRTGHRRYRREKR